MNQQIETPSRPTTYFVIKIALVIVLFLAMINIPLLQERRWLQNLVNGAWTFLLPSIIVSIVRYIIISIYSTRQGKSGKRGNFILGINQLTVILNAAFFGLALMVGLGINPIEFLTSMTIVAMAIAVTFRDYITNMISGLFIMFSDQLSVGDRIKVGGEKGRVEDITFSNIVLKNEEDDIVMVPNNFFYTQPIINLSVHRSHFFYVKFELPFAAAHHADELERDLRGFLSAHAELDGQHDMGLQVQEIGKDFAKFKIELMARSSSDRLHRSIENDVLKRILLFKGRYI